MASMLAPAVEGELLSCQYLIRVKPNYGNCDCCRNSPVLQMPMTIIPPEFDLTEAPVPEGWAPQVYDPVNF
jgi:hypothetical protein